VRELKGIAKVFLQPGESKRIEITVPQKTLAYYDVLMNECSEKGWFDVWMAHDSASGEHGLIEC
jgi:beta-glucosidase